MFKSFSIPILQWHVWVRDYQPEHGSRWAWWRDRCQERVVRFPVGPWSVEVFGRGKTYAQLVGFDLPIGWILDEFDASFNELACASLKYHLEYSVARNEDQRPVYEDLITRLSEPAPDVCDTPEKRAVYLAHEQIDSRNARITTPPAVREIYDNYWEREHAYQARIQQARHDFIDILRQLWS